MRVYALLSVHINHSATAEPTYSQFSVVSVSSSVPKQAPSRECCTCAYTNTNSCQRVCTPLPSTSPPFPVVSFLPTVHTYMQYYKSFVPTRVLQAHPPPRAATRLSRTRCACLRSPPVISHANSRTASAPTDLKCAPRRAVHTSTAPPPPTSDDSCHAPKHPRALQPATHHSPIGSRPF